MKKIYSATQVSNRPSYLIPKKGPSEETKQIWKLASEVNFINKQTEFIKEYNMKPSDFSQLNQKKLNIL